MIFDSIKNIDKYNLESDIIDILKRAEKFSADNYSTDKIELENGNFILPNDYSTHPKDRHIFEAHRKYIDVMYMVDGEEIIKVKSTDKLNNITSPYSEDGDYLLGEETSDFSLIHLKASDFIILYPGDAHCPSCSVGEVPTKVKKVIGKVRISE